MSIPASQISLYKLTLAYDGRAFFGWQRHGDKPTVQFALEQAVTKAFGVRAAVQGSGRTDRGTHAHGQVASLQLPGMAPPEIVKEQLNQFLPLEIRILDVCCAAKDFHACDSAVAKRYRYLIWNHLNLPAEHDGRVWHVKEPLDVQAMVDACSVFIKVGEGRDTREELFRILEAGDRQAAPGTAPASGLYLEQVFYSQQELSDNLGKRVLP